jgi:hypothetical protein
MMEKEIRIRGRIITSADLELIRHLLHTEGHLASFPKAMPSLEFSASQWRLS